MEARFRVVKRDRYFAVYDGKELVCVCVYKKGALAVVERLARAEEPKEG